ELNGVSANSPQGLKISAGNSTIRGLVINRFNSCAIYIYSNGGNVITGNYIGTDFTGSADFPSPNNGQGGFMNTPNNTIGGSSPADRNVVSGNRNACCSTGVYVDTASAKGNKVLGNYIGTNASGMAALDGMGNGIVLSNCSQTIVGGLTAA